MGGRAQRAAWVATLGDLRRLAMPVVLSDLGGVANTVVATIIVGPLGADAIGALGLGSALFGVISVFGVGLLLGLDPLVSQSYGAQRLDECRRWLFQGVLLSLLVAVPLTVLMYLIAQSLPLWGLAADSVRLAVPFLEVRALAILPHLLFAAFRRYLQGMSLARPVALVTWAINLVSFATAVVLVHGLGPFPLLGVVGAAWAALAGITGAVVALAAVVRYVNREQGAQPTGGLLLPSPRRLRRLTALGLPAALQASLEVGVFAAATALAGAIDSVSLAAHQIVLQLTVFPWIATVGIGGAGGVLVGQAIGAGDPTLGRRRGWTALSAGVAFMSCVALVMLAAPGPLLGVFTQDPAVVEVSRPLLVIAAAFQLFDGLQAVATGVLRGLGDTRTPMIANLTSHWLLGLPLGYFLTFTLGLGVAGLWVGLSVGLIAVSIILVASWHFRSRSDAPRPAVAS